MSDRPAAAGARGLLHRLPPHIRHELGQSSVLLTGSLLSALLSMVYMVWVGRRLGPGAAGDFYAAIFVVFFLVTALSPIGTHVARIAAALAARGELSGIAAVVRRAAKILLWCCFGAALVLSLSLRPVAKLLRFDDAQAFGLAFFAAAIWIWLSIHRGALRGRHRFLAYSLNLVGEALLRLLIGVALVSALPLASTAILAHALAAAVALVALCVLDQPAKAPEATPQGPPGARAMSMGLFWLALADAGSQNLDVLAAKLLFEPNLVGHLGAVASITRVLGVVATPLVVLLLPLLVARVEHGLNASRTLARVCGYFLALATPILVVFAVAPESLVVGLFGSPFLPAAPLLLFHGASMALSYVAMLLGLAFVALNRYGFLWTYLIGLAAMLPAIYFARASPLTMVQAVLVVKLVIVIGLVANWLAIHSGSGGSLPKRVA